MKGGKRKNRQAPDGARRFWLGWRDSNPRMRESKSRALPLGDTPVLVTNANDFYCVVGMRFGHTSADFHRYILLGSRMLLVSQKGLEPPKTRI